MASSSSRQPGVAAALMWLLSGCAVGPNFHRPDAPAVAHYREGADPQTTIAAQGHAQSLDINRDVDVRWWQLFGSTQLDTAMAEALLQNPGLEAAQASLRASENTLRSGYGIFFPTADAAAAASRERLSSLSLGQNVSTVPFNLFTLSTSVSYALDLFGGQRRLVEGLRSQVDLARANHAATYLTLTTNLVNTVIAAAAYQTELDATEELVTLQREQVQIAEVQASAGTVSYSSVLSLRSQLASIEATLPQLEQKIVQANDLLASLVGKTPAQWQAPQMRLTDLTLPDSLPLSVPSKLVAQRPDILMAEATAHAASANIGVATAAMLPEVNLSAAATVNSAATSFQFPANGHAWSVAGSVTTPLFEGGTLWFRRKAAVESFQQSMALYHQTVLNAFEQVADTLSALEHDAIALRAEDEALLNAQQALHLVQVNYQAGLATYLDVLTADAQYHQSLINEVQASALRYQDTVALYAALGGGWWHSGQ